MAELRATPYANPLTGLTNDAIQGLLAFMQDKRRTQQLQGLGNLLESTGIPKTVERAAYAESPRGLLDALTNVNRANVPFLKPETAEALLTLSPVPSGANKAAMAAGRAGERVAERVVPQIMERGGVPAGLLQDLAQGTQSQIITGRKAGNFDYIKELEALSLKEQGVPQKEILQKTGIYFGPEGKSRAEISDLEALVNLEKLPKITSPKQTYDEYIKTKMYEQGDTLPEGNLEDEARKYAQQVYSQQVNNVTQLQDVLNHPELYEAYPQLKRYGVSGLLGEGSLKGSFNPAEQRIRVLGDRTPDEIKSTLLHEVQHAVQEIEGFSKGGNPDVARGLLKGSFREEIYPLRLGESLFEDAADNYGKASKGLYMHKLAELTQRQNITPSQITNMSPFYQYSTEIRQELGAMPKRSGYEQKNWLRSAAQIIYDKEFNQGKFRDVVGLEQKELESLKRKASREMEKYREDARESSKIKNKYKNLESLSDYEIYRRLGGEAESRAVQQRMNIPKQSLLETLPLESYDVPLNEIIPKGIL